MADENVFSTDRYSVKPYMVRFKISSGQRNLLVLQMTPCFVSVSCGQVCASFSVENSFSKVSWSNILDADGNRARFYGIASPRKITKQNKISKCIRHSCLNIGNLGWVITRRIVIIIKHIIKCFLAVEYLLSFLSQLMFFDYYCKSQ